MEDVGGNELVLSNTNIKTKKTEEEHMLTTSNI